MNTDTSSEPLPLVRLDRVSLAFGNTRIFSRLSLRIKAGGHLALIGPNGAGKSSLLRLIQGELRPALYAASPPRNGSGQPPGRIYWAFAGKEETSALAARQHARLVSAAQQSNYVRQGWNITGEEVILSGLDNAAMVYGELSSRRYEEAAKLAEAAQAVDLLAMHAPAMSQGQLRLMLILRALISKPKLLLLDEPFDGLDARAREAVRQSIRLAAGQGATVMVSAHRQEDIPSFISRCLFLHDGKLVETEVAMQPPEAGEVEQTEMPVTLSERPAVSVAGRPDAAHSPTGFLRALASGAEPLLRLRHVDVFIERQKVLADISWTVRRGEQWIVSGPNGSGKSTLLRLLYGEEFAAFGGSLEWCGNMRPALDELHSGIGYVSDRLQHAYNYDLSAEGVVVSGLRGSIGLYHEPSHEERELARTWLERLGVAGYAAVPLYDLSSGTARKVLLARALAASPPVLLLDEPCSGLDPGSRARFLGVLPLLASRGVQIIYVSHHENDKSPLFSHELRLEKGRIVFAGKREKA